MVFGEHNNQGSIAPSFSWGERENPKKIGLQPQIQFPKYFRLKSFIFEDPFVNHYLKIVAIERYELWHCLIWGRTFA